VKFSDLLDQGRIAAGGVADFASNMMQPTVRLGVTGLSRSGKTVFITALVQALLNGARLPLFDAHAMGRISRVYLEPQPNDDLPRFSYEDHLEALTGPERHWPEGTRRISQLRLTFEYEPQGLLARNLHGGVLHLDIVDYPGEWLLDLPLMTQTYAQWSAGTLAASRKQPRLTHAGDWHRHLATLEADGRADEQQVIRAAQLFTAYLARCRQDDVSQSTLPPGRFLMPGDLAGSPLLSFAPLDIAADVVPRSGTLAALMNRRYDAYVARVVRPFFFEHFARLDRQIVLVDVMTALNAGASAVADLRQALGNVLSCFRIGSNSLLSEVFGKRIDRILFAATKADLLHHTSHDRLENILRTLVDEAAGRAADRGSAHDIAALSAIRATREATVTQKGETLSCIVGTPQNGEQIGETIFDGTNEAAIFPGDLPEDPARALDGSLEGLLRFVRFRPPVRSGDVFPHIRLDRTIEFLIGDRFK
jgi:uncharacterized protein